MAETPQSFHSMWWWAQSNKTSRTDVHIWPHVDRVRGVPSPKRLSLQGRCVRAVTTLGSVWRICGPDSRVLSEDGRGSCQIKSYSVPLFCYLVDDLGFKGGNDAGIVKDRKLLIHLMKHRCSLENSKMPTFIFDIIISIYFWSIISLGLDRDSFSPPQPAHCYRLRACIQALL